MPLDCEPYDDDAALAFAMACKARWQLTLAQGRILFLMCCGHTAYKELARLTYTGHATVSEHRHRIYERMGVRDTLGAVLAAWPLYATSRKERP